MIKKHIPNTITCCNLLCGCLAIVQAFNGEIVTAAYLVILATIFDFFDGFAARLLHVSSNIGKDLDSLADMVTFGVVPGILMYKLTTDIIENNGMDISTHIAYLAFAIPIFSAVRLAKFNNDTRQSESFIGLPTPANAMFIVAYCMLSMKVTNNSSIIFLFHPYTICALSLLLSVLLLAEIPLFALKFKHFKWAGNEIRFIFLILSLILLICFQFLGVMLIILLYMMMSIINNKLIK